MGELHIDLKAGQPELGAGVALAEELHIDLKVDRGFAGKDKVMVLHTGLRAAPVRAFHTDLRVAPVRAFHADLRAVHDSAEVAAARGLHTVLRVDPVRAFHTDLRAVPGSAGVAAPREPRTVLRVALGSAEVAGERHTALRLNLGFVGEERGRPCPYQVVQTAFLLEALVLAFLREALVLAFHVVHLVHLQELLVQDY